jgi:hypothetical protein
MDLIEIPAGKMERHPWELARAACILGLIEQRDFEAVALFLHIPLLAKMHSGAARKVQASHLWKRRKRLDVCRQPSDDAVPGGAVQG